MIGIVTKAKVFEPVINSIEDYYTYAQRSAGSVYIPKTAWPIIYQYDEPENVVIRVESTDFMTAAGKECADLLNGYLSPQDETIQYRAKDLLEQAQQMWDFWQEYRQNMGWTEEELLTNNACSRQIQEAGQALQAQFEADLPQAVLADDLARTKAWNEHFEELVAQYQPQLLSAEQIQFLAENLTGEVTIGYGQ